MNLGMRSVCCPASPILRQQRRSSASVLSHGSWKPHTVWSDKGIVAVHMCVVCRVKKECVLRFWGMQCMKKSGGKAVGLDSMEEGLELGNSVPRRLNLGH